MNYRSLRAGNLIRDELAKIIVRELEFPNALLTITDVEVDKSLDWATVRVSVLPSTEAKNALALLRKEGGRLQRLLWKRINIKPMPKIRFELDPGPEKAATVEKVLLEE